MSQDGAVGPILIAGVLSGVLALLAFGLRGTKVHTGPGLPLASIIVSALPITFAVLITIMLRREAEAQVWLSLRALQAVPGQGEWPTVPAADEGTIEKLKAQFAPVWPSFDQCLATTEVTEPIRLSLILRRSGIEEVRETSEPAHPAAVRCLVGQMVHLQVSSLTPVQAEFTFSR